MLPEIPFGHFLLPILPVLGRHINAPHIVPFKTSIVDVVALRIASRDRQRRDAADSTKHVLSRSRSEFVYLEMFLPLEGFERGLFDDETLEA